MDDGTQVPALPRRRLVLHALTPEAGSPVLGLAVLGVGVAGVRMSVTTAGGATVFAGTAFGLLGRGNVRRRPAARHLTFAVLAGWAAVSVLVYRRLSAPRCNGWCTTTRATRSTPLPSDATSGTSCRRGGRRRSRTECSSAWPWPPATRSVVVPTSKRVCWSSSTGASNT